MEVQEHETIGEKSKCGKGQWCARNVGSVYLKYRNKGTRGYMRTSFLVLRWCLIIE